ncbi:MAG: chemotaxis protein CheW [Archangium sp.]
MNPLSSSALSSRGRPDMANVQLCTFVVGDQWFGLPVTDVQEVMRAQAMTRVPRAPKHVSGLIHLRGQIATAIDMRVRLGVPPAPADAERFNMMVADGDHGVVSLIVDLIGDVLELGDARFEHTPAPLAVVFGEAVRGVYKLDDKLLLLLDVRNVIHPKPKAEA